MFNEFSVPLYSLNGRDFFFLLCHFVFRLLSLLFTFKQVHICEVEMFLKVTAVVSQLVHFSYESYQVIMLVPHCYAGHSLSLKMCFYLWKKRNSYVG